MLQPRKQKYRKQFRGKMHGQATAGNQVSFGEYGLQALECKWINARQIEASRRAIANYTKRKGKYWVRIFPDKPITKKPAEVRMGSGKGPVEAYVVVIKPGRIMFEIGGVDDKTAIEALERAAQKLPITTRIVNVNSLFA